ncbi:MAG: hypothetical protein V9F82_14630 [Dermatophilaceae bacterium]
MPLTSPVPDEVQTELTRLARRWRQLPLGQAQSYAAQLRAAARELADAVPVDDGAGARADTEIRDLGPAAALDQLRVLVYDASAAGLTLGLAERLAVLRRAVT